MKATNIFAGGGIGILVGFLLGLSVSPMVGTVVAGLTALLAAFFGLSEGFGEKPTSDEPAPSKEAIAREQSIAAGYGLRVGAFGFACVVGVLLGIAVRGQNLLSESPDDHFSNWKAMGFTEEKARELVVYQELSLVPSGSQQVVSEPRGARPADSVLFAETGENCEDLRPNKYSDTDELLRAWKLQEGLWAELVVQLETYLSPERRERAADQFWSGLRD